MSGRGVSKGQIASYVFIAACFAALVAYLFASGDAMLLPQALSWPNSLWLLVALCSMIGGWLFEGLVLYEMARGLSQPIPYKAAVRSTMVVQFFNNVTPSSTGGQPMQVWSLWRDGVPVGEAGSVLLGKFAVYQAALVTCGVAAFAYAHTLFLQQVGGWVWLFIVAFILQAGICVMLFAIIIKPRSVRWLAERLAALLSHTPARNLSAKAMVKASGALDRFETDSRALIGRPGVFARTYLMTLVQLQSVLVVPFCICRALGLEPQLLLVLSAAAFVLMVSAVFPTPGAGGGAEGTFLLVFGLFFPEGTSVAAGVLLWRLLTFYFPVAAGAPFTAGAPKNRKPPE